ncbi:MAG: hypothetical protein P1U67_07705 [Alcanivoracaceae bacterium]|nr:hypothetical protein [Alcanivoracaceae bacterium]
MIELEDLKTGVAITDLGLNDFRMDQLNYVKANGLHTVIPVSLAKGLEPSFIFTRRNGNGEINSASHLPAHNLLHPYYLVYISYDGQVLNDHIQVKSLLDLARSAWRGLDQLLPAVRAFF